MDPDSHDFVVARRHALAPLGASRLTRWARIGAAGLSPYGPERRRGMDPQHPIDVDLAEVVPEPPAMALSWDRLRQRAVRRQGHRRAGLAAVAVLLLAAVGGATQWWADHRPVRVRQELATSAAPSTAVSATPTPHPTPTAASVVVSGDVDGDGRPDTVTLSSRRLTVSLATGHTASRELPAYGTVRQLQAVSDLLGLGRAQILIGESTAGCCAGKPVDSVSQILVYERGALRPIPATDGQLFTLDFSLGSRGCLRGSDLPTSWPDRARSRSAGGHDRRTHADQDRVPGHHASSPTPVAAPVDGRRRTRRLPGDGARHGNTLPGAAVRRDPAAPHGSLTNSRAGRL